MPRLLQIVHGYPPRELAGTEIYAERITEALGKRGWEVHILAATRAPGKKQASWLAPEDSGAGGQIHRIVNNLPWRPLEAGERDPAIFARCSALIGEIAPDIVHIQHLLFLDIGLEWKAPTVYSLHDAWGWCARGGSLLELGKKPCPGPSPDRCGPCYADFSAGSAVEHQLGRVAGRLDAVVPIETLHKAWRALPARVRSLSQKGRPKTSSPKAVEKRQEALREAFNSFDLRLSPSKFLANSAEKQGMGSVEVLPHGASAKALPRSPEHFLFLGSLAFHKGPQVVADAWKMAANHDSDLPPLRLVGPKVDAKCVAGLPSDWVDPPVHPKQVPALLAKTHALVLGSIWPENAPLVILEARASGCPVIAPAIGGIPELIQEGTDGWLYPPGNVEALADRLKQWRSFKSLQVRSPMAFEAHLEGLIVHYQSLLD